MRRKFQTSLTALTTSKRIAVALCAAIAMILGAMSVGATIHPNAGDPSGQEPLANQEDPATVQGVQQGTKKPKSVTKSFNKQSTMVPILIPAGSNQSSRPQLITPSITSQTSL